MNIIITGTGKGNGYQLAKKISVLSGNKLFFISRSIQSLNKLRNECKSININNEIEIFPFDLEEIVYKNNYPKINCQHIDILINNAGYLVNKPFGLLEKNEIDKMMNVNFLAPTLFIKKLSSQMGGNTPTHIVNIGSMGGFQGSSKYPGLSIYSASKGALAILTECIATEFNNKNIYCNCLALGSVQTEMLETAFPGYNAPVQAEQMAEYIMEFALNGYKYYNGKVIPVGQLSV